MTATAIGSAPDLSLSHAPGTALRLRRWCLVAAPVLAGVLAVVGAAADPAAGIEGEEMWRIYAAEPGPLQIKSVALHWSYALWTIPAVLLARYVRGRGAALANVAGFLGFVSATTLPGLLFIDFYDSAIGQVGGVETNVAVEAAMSGMWGVPVMAVPGLVGFALALPLAMSALWRAGLVRWWGPVAAVAALAVFVVSGVQWWGAVLSTLALALVSLAVATATRRDPDAT